MHIQLLYGFDDGVTEATIDRGKAAMNSAAKAQRGHITTGYLFGVERLQPFVSPLSASEHQNVMLCAREHETPIHGIAPLLHQGLARHPLNPAANQIDSCQEWILLSPVVEGHLPLGGDHVRPFN